jgi:hypothetical protein
MKRQLSAAVLATAAAAVPDVSADGSQVIAQREDP